MNFQASKLSKSMALSTALFVVSLTVMGYFAFKLKNNTELKEQMETRISNQKRRLRSTETELKDYRDKLNEAERQIRQVKLRSDLLFKYASPVEFGHKLSELAIKSQVEVKKLELGEIRDSKTGCRFIEGNFTLDGDEKNIFRFLNQIKSLPLDYRKVQLYKPKSLLHLELSFRILEKE